MQNTVINPPKETPISFVRSVTHQYVSALTQRYHWPLGALSFTESGFARAAAVFGWIIGLYDSGHTEVAEKLAEDIVGQFDRFADYGGMREHPMGNRMQEFPNCLIELGDDGSLHGFSVLYFRLASAGKEVQALTPSSVRMKTYAWDKFYYTFSMNGGLIYHGPRDRLPTLEEVTGRHLWASHT